MLEERTYWAGMIYPRWIKTDHHKLIANTFFDTVPAFIRMPLFRMVAIGVTKAALGHGIGRHTDAEIFQLGLDDVKTVETLLGQNKFMLGDKPAEVDATVFSFLSGMAAEVFPTTIQSYIVNSKPLSTYLARMDRLCLASKNLINLRVFGFWA